MTVIALIGMPGVGKTTVGRRLARLLERHFVDSDREIERRLGMSVAECFSQHGENVFRDMEQQVVEELARRERCVLATGGGAVLRECNRRVLSECGTVVYLRASPRRLAQRTRGSRRPLLAGGDPLGRLEQLFQQRAWLYEQVAEFTLDVHGLSPQRLAREIAYRLGWAEPSDMETHAAGDESAAHP